MQTLTELVYANPKAKQQAMAMSLTQPQHQHQHHQYRVSHHLVSTEMFHPTSNSNKKSNSNSNANSSKGYLSNHMVMASNSSSSASHEPSSYPSSSMSSSGGVGLYDLQSQTIMQSQSMSVYQSAYLSNNNNTNQPNQNLLLPSSSSSSTHSFSGYDTNTSLSMLATVGHPFENTPFPIHPQTEGSAFVFSDHQLRDENSNLTEFSATEAIVFNHQQQHSAINMNHPSMLHNPDQVHLQMHTLLSHQLMAPSSSQQQHQHSAKETQQQRSFHQQQQHHFHQHQHQHHPYHQYQQSSRINQTTAGPSEEETASTDVVPIGLSPSMPSTSNQLVYFSGPSTSSSPTSPPMVLAEHQSCMISMQQNNSRESRNLAEKNRREKLNGYVQKLANCVPHVQDSTRRVDKTGVLRFAAHGLRMEYVFGSSMHEHIVDEEMAETLLSMVDSFIIVVNMRGHVVMVSSCMEQQMGHAQLDMLGQNILNFAHPGDRPHVRKAILPDELDTIFDIVQPVEGLTREEVIEDQLESDRRRFTFRFARAGPRTEPTQYEFVRWEGCFRSADSAPRGGQPDHPYPAGLQLSRRARTRDDFLPTHVNGNDIVFVAGMHVIKPPSLRDRLRDACRFEYKTRHLIDGRIVQCDQRISLVAGYMADEVCGLSPFTFMHRADVRWVMIALRQMYESFDVTGESCYRLISRTGRFIYLRTEGFMEVGSSNFISSFVCRNTLMPDDEGERLLGVMKEQFSMYVKEMEEAAARDALMPSSPDGIKYPTLMAAPMEEQERQMALAQMEQQAQAVMPAVKPAQHLQPVTPVKLETVPETGLGDEELPLNILMPILPQDSASHEAPVTDREIGTMVAGIHSMLRGLPIAEIATTAIENHHLRDLPSDAALADIHRRRRELKTIFKYGMPDKQQTLVSVQRSMFVIHRSHLVSDDSGADSGGELFNDPLPSDASLQSTGSGSSDPVASCSYSSGSSHMSEAASSTHGKVQPKSASVAAAAGPSNRIGGHHHHQAGRAGDLSPTRACQLTDASMRRLLGTEQRITLEEKTENYRNLLSSSKVRLMENVHGDHQFPLSPSSSVTSMPSPAVSCSSTEHECGGGGGGSVGSGGVEPHPVNELVARTKCTAKSRSPSLVAGRQREFCSDVGGFRPEVLVRSDEWSLRNPRIKSKKPRRIDAAIKRRAVGAVELVGNGSGAEEQLQQPSSSKRLAIQSTALGGAEAAGPQSVPCGSQRLTTAVGGSADYCRLPVTAVASSMCSQNGARVPMATATATTSSPYLHHPALNTSSAASGASASAASMHVTNPTIAMLRTDSSLLARSSHHFGAHTTGSYEDSLGDRLSEAGSDLSQMLSPSSVGSMVHDPSLMFIEPAEDGDLDDLVIGQDLLLSTINSNDMSQDPPQSIVKQDYQVIYMPQHKHNGGDSSGATSGLHIDAHSHPSISVELDDVDDLCEVPR